MSNVSRGKRGTVDRSRFNFVESKLRPGQRQAAMMLVEHEFTPFKERTTQTEIAEEIGVSRMTIHRWNTQDPNFIAYKNYLAADFFDSYLPLVYSKMLDGIKNGSMKGIELYLKRIGDLDNRSEVTINDGGSSDKSFEERKKDLLERMKSENADGGE